MVDELYCAQEFLVRVKNPKRYEFERHLGRKVIVGLRGVSENGNEVVGYIPGFVGKQKGKLGLYQYVSEGGEGIANKIMPIDLEVLFEKSPIVEALFPSVISSVEIANYVTGKERVDLTFLVKSQDLRSTYRYHFESQR